MITLLWITGHLLSEITEPDSKPTRVLELMIAFAGIGAHVCAFFLEGTTRQEVMYARDNILAFLLLILVIQIMEFLSLHQMFGPWSVIIASLIIDVIKFLIIMLLFIVAFTLQIAVAYKPVYHKTLIEIPTDILPFTTKDQGLLTIFDELFFTILGDGGRPRRLTDAEHEFSPEATYVIATVVYALYMILATVVLINLLIAMMSNTYTILEERSDVEWKYGRASIIRNMIKSYSMPVPANILATLLTIIWVSLVHKCCCCFVRIDHFAKKKKNKGDEEDPDDDSSTSEMSYDPEDESAPVPILHVVPWKTIVDELRANHGIEEIPVEMFSIYGEDEEEEEKEEKEEEEED